MPRAIAGVILVFLLAVLLTESAYLGDTARYMNEIQNHRAHLVAASRDPFWDFGHPAWRPLVNAVYDIAGGTVQNMRGGDARQALAWLMIAMNMLATLAAVLLLWSLLKRHSNFLSAGIGSAVFLCTNAVLDYSRSGSSYIPALACVTRVLLVMAAEENASSAPEWHFRSKPAVG